jgi:hypothetical protein
MTMLSGEEILREKKGRKERRKKREVLIRTLINLFCSDASVGNGGDARAWRKREKLVIEHQ